MIVSFILYARSAEKSIPYRIFSRSVFHANLHPQLFEIILFLIFAEYPRNQTINIDAGDFNCYNIGKEYWNSTWEWGACLCLYSFRSKTTGLSKIVRWSVLPLQRISPWSLICCTRTKRGRFYRLLLFTEQGVFARTLWCDPVYRKCIQLFRVMEWTRQQAEKACCLVYHQIALIFFRYATASVCPRK